MYNFSLYIIVVSINEFIYVKSSVFMWNILDELKIALFMYSREAEWLLWSQITLNHIPVLLLLLCDPRPVTEPQASLIQLSDGES